MEPLRIQHTIRSFPFFQLSGLAPIVNGLGLSDDSYLDTYIPENGYWMQHTIHTVRIVESQQRLLYRIRKNILEGIGEEDCTSLLAEVEMQQQLISSKKQVRVGQPGPSLDVGLPTPLTPAIPSSVIKEVSEKSPRKRLASEVHLQDFEQGPSATKIHIPNNFYLASHNETAGPDVSPASSPVLPAETVVDEHPASSASDVDPVSVSHGVASAGPEYLYQNQVYYSQTSPDTLSSPIPAGTPISANATTGTVSYHPHLPHPHLPIKRWPNDYSVAEISAGFHDMDRLVAQTPSMTQRVAFERIFGSRYVKSTVCRHRGVWKRASPATREQFIALGHDERVLWGEFVRTVEGRQTAKSVGSRIVASVPSSAHEAIAFSADAGAEGELVDVGDGSDALQGQGVGHDSTSSAVEEPIMDSLQNPTVSGEDDAKDPDDACEFSPPSDINRTILHDFIFTKWWVAMFICVQWLMILAELNVFDTSLSHISSTQT